ncbi:MAG: polyhydroxyalkanoate synthesis repressor PhaR [Candidatus Riflebacteria bacterium]|nr:polyhydroxyalkanoate synthesis repressor PhaR [Candidatus Riflebacteria bacterium]
MRRNEAGQESTATVVLKKYGNRRLYDTARSCYVTLEDVAGMVKAGVEIVVNDARTGEDLTRLTLLQIIIEHQKNRVDLLPVPFLRQLLTYREDTLRQFFDRYLGLSLEMFSTVQDRFTRTLQERFQSALGSLGTSREAGRERTADVESLQRRIEELERRLALAGSPAASAGAPSPADTATARPGRSRPARRAGAKPRPRRR